MLDHFHRRHFRDRRLRPGRSPIPPTYSDGQPVSGGMRGGAFEHSPGAASDALVTRAQPGERLGEQAAGAAADVDCRLGSPAALAFEESLPQCASILRRSGHSPAVPGWSRWSIADEPLVPPVRGHFAENAQLHAGQPVALAAASAMRQSSIRAPHYRHPRAGGDPTPAKQTGLPWRVS